MREPTKAAKDGWGDVVVPFPEQQDRDAAEVLLHRVSHLPLFAVDLFCCAGGASDGLARAGFEVAGMDRDEQPEYPHQFAASGNLSDGKGGDS